MHEQDFAKLFGKRPTTIKLDLERMRAAHLLLGEPALRTPTILVGGTNGKGTTCAFLTQLLRHAGFKVGLYTSPHLVHVSERIQVTGENIDDEQIRLQWQSLQKRLPASLYADLTFFEVITLIAFMQFAASDTDVNVVEVGLGGRLDATNILDPLVSVVTSIGLDHQQYLGNTISLITGEKAAIARTGRSLFFGQIADGSRSSAESTAKMNAYAKAHQVPLLVAGEDFVVAPGPKAAIELQLPGLKYLRLSLSAAMRAQPLFIQRNFALAVAVVYQLFAEEKLPRPDPAQSTETFLKTAVKGFPYADQPWPATASGRFQRLQVQYGTAKQRRELILDVGHNPDGIQALHDALMINAAGSETPRRFPGFVSILADRDFNAMLDVLKGILDPIVLFRIDHERSWQQQQLAPAHQQLPFFGDFASAWAHAESHFPKSSASEPWIVCGSVLAVGDVLQRCQVKLGTTPFGKPLLGHLPRNEQ